MSDFAFHSTLRLPALSQLCHHMSVLQRALARCSLSLSQPPSHLRLPARLLPSPSRPNRVECRVGVSRLKENTTIDRLPFPPMRLHQSGCAPEGSARSRARERRKIYGAGQQVSPQDTIRKLRVFSEAVGEQLAPKSRSPPIRNKECELDKDGPHRAPSRAR